MGKLAFLYPGQGSQKVGMGSDIARQEAPLFEQYLGAAQRVSGRPVTHYCLEGPLEQLSQTDVAQPALFAHALALHDWARRQGIQPDFVAGHSLGEYTAAVAAGALSFEEGLYLVCQRGRLMQRVQTERPGSMCAIIGLPVVELQSLCQEISSTDVVSLANWNTETQIIISGSVDGVLKFSHAIKAMQRGRVIPLNAQGAFHSPLMKPVQVALREITQWLHWRDSEVPLVANCSGQLVHDGQQIRNALLEQITSPVQWVACVQSLVEAGCDTFVEIGVGQVLSKLVRTIAPQAHVITLGTLEQISSYAQERQRNLRVS